MRDESPSTDPTNSADLQEMEQERKTWSGLGSGKSDSLCYHHFGLHVNEVSLLFSVVQQTTFYYLKRIIIFVTYTIWNVSSAPSMPSLSLLLSLYQRPHRKCPLLPASQHCHSCMQLWTSLPPLSYCYEAHYSLVMKLVRGSGSCWPQRARTLSWGVVVVAIGKGCSGVANTDRA